MYIFNAFIEVNMQSNAPKAPIVIYQPPQTIVYKGITCKLLGLGTYNDVYKFYDPALKKKMVLKIQRQCDRYSKPHKVDDLKLDHPSRSVELWNVINSHIKPNASLVFNADGSILGWVCPYIKGKLADPYQICLALIDIFNKTGRIVLDAPCNNFIVTPDGKIVCIDVGLLLQLEERDIHFTELTRRKSVASLLRETAIIHNMRFFDKYNSDHQQEITPILDILKALIIIKNFRPNIVKVDFLKTHHILKRALVKAYDDNSTLFTALDLLETAIPESHLKTAASITATSEVKEEPSTLRR